MNREQHVAYLRSLVDQADAAVERIIVAQDALRRLEREMRSLDRRADKVEKQAAASGTPVLDMIADEVRSRKAEVLRSSAHLSRTGLALARSSADFALEVRNAMDRAARQPPPRFGAWSDRRAMRRTLAEVQARASRCETAVDDVSKAQDRVKF